MERKRGRPTNLDYKRVLQNNEYVKLAKLGSKSMNEDEIEVLKNIYRKYWSESISLHEIAYNYVFIDVSYDKSNFNKWMKRKGNTKGNNLLLILVWAHISDYISYREA